MRVKWEVKRGRGRPKMRWMEGVKIMWKRVMEMSGCSANKKKRQGEERKRTIVRRAHHCASCCLALSLTLSRFTVRVMHHFVAEYNRAQLVIWLFLWFSLAMCLSINVSQYVSVFPSVFPFTIPFPVYFSMCYEYENRQKCFSICLFPCFSLHNIVSSLVLYVLWIPQPNKFLSRALTTKGDGSLLTPRDKSSCALSIGASLYTVRSIKSHHSGIKSDA